MGVAAGVAGGASGTAVAGLFQELGGAVGRSGTAVSGSSQEGALDGGGGWGFGGSAGCALGGSGKDALDCASALLTGARVHTRTSHHPTERRVPTIDLKL